jgi:hypothetical protein
MTMKPITSALVLAGVMLATAALIKYAAHTHLLGPDGEARSIQIAIGLMLAGYGNVIPKSVSKYRGQKTSARVQSALRVGGWAFVLAGLAQTGLWIFAPITIADPVSTAAVATALVVTLGYAIWVHATCSRGETSSAAH